MPSTHPPRTRPSSVSVSKTIASHENARTVCHDAPPATDDGAIRARERIRWIWAVFLEKWLRHANARAALCAGITFALACIDRARGDARSVTHTQGEVARRTLCPLFAVPLSDLCAGAAWLAATTMLLVPPGRAIAQETRAEIIRQEQADKLRTVTPPELNRAEKIVNRLEDWGLLTGEPRGVYPLLDSIYPGGGFAAGLGARKPFGDDGAISVIGAYSINSFWRAQTDVTLPSFASNRGRVSLTAGYLDAPDVSATTASARTRRRMTRHPSATRP